MSWPARATWRVQPPTSTAQEACFTTYLHWRQACENARAAYERWRSSEPLERRLAFAAFRAALDAEDHAARAHSDSIGTRAAAAAA
jgi:hypothetical protein